MTVGQRVKQKRVDLGLSVDDLALILGKNRATIYRYESDEIENLPITIIEPLAKALHCTPAYLMGWNDNSQGKGVKIPVLGKVAAGIPIEAVEDIIDYEEISFEMAMAGEYFALQINGDSMMPRMQHGDVVIVRKQSSVDSGETAVVLVNGGDATVKKVKVTADGMLLIPTNPAFEPMFYSKKEITTLPVTIIGKVVELRGKF